MKAKTEGHTFTGSPLGYELKDGSARSRVDKLIVTDKYYFAQGVSETKTKYCFFCRRSDNHMCLIPSPEDTEQLLKDLQKLDRLNKTDEIDQIAEGYDYD